MKIITYMLLYDSNKEYEIYAIETMIIIIGIPSFTSVKSWFVLVSFLSYIDGILRERRFIIWTYTQ